MKVKLVTPAILAIFFAYSAFADVVACDPNNTPCPVGYTCEPDPIPELPSSSLTSNSIQYRATVTNGGYTSNRDNDLLAGEFKLVYTSGSVTGFIKGETSCITSVNASAMPLGTAPLNTGRYCWCRLTEWDGTGEQPAPLLSSWVYNYDGSSKDGCGKVCARYCAEDIQKNKSNRRTTLFDSLVPPGYHCEYNSSAVIIELDWDPQNGDQHSTTYCEYGSTLDVPTPNPTKPGYTFYGWASAL